MQANEHLKGKCLTTSKTELKRSRASDRMPGQFCIGGKEDERNLFLWFAI